MSSLEVLENTSERELRVTISEAEFFAWRDKKPEFQDAIGVDRPVITVKSEAEIQELLSSGDTITVVECIEVMYKNKSMRNRMTNSGWDMPRRIWETLDDETREKIHAMAYMDSSYSIREEDLANRLTYQTAYFGPLMPYAALNLSEEVKAISSSSAAELSEIYGEQIRSDLIETQRAIVQCYRKLQRQIIDGKFPFLDTEAALERMERIQFRIQDPLSFRQEWRKIDTHNYDPRHIKAYYLENAHAVVMPTVWGERDIEGVKQTVMHELFHALGAASYIQDVKSGQVFIKRLGLAGYVQINARIVRLTTVRPPKNTTPRKSKPPYQKRCTLCQRKVEWRERPALQWDIHRIHKMVFIQVIEMF